MRFRAAPILFALVLLLAVLPFAPSVLALTFADGFEADAIGAYPADPSFTFIHTGGSTNYVAADQAYAGAHSWKNNGDQPTGFQMTNGFDMFAAGATGNSVNLAFRLASGASGANGMALYVSDTSGGYLKCGNAGPTGTHDEICISIQGSTSAAPRQIGMSLMHNTAVANTNFAPNTVMTENRWYTIGLVYTRTNALDGTPCSCVTATLTDTTTSAVATATLASGVPTTVGKYITWSSMGVGGGIGTTWTDSFGASDSIGSTGAYTEVAVAGITGGSMDESGRSLMTRDANGAKVHSYSVQNLAAGAQGEALTPNCTGRSNGVLTEALTDQNDPTTDRIWNTYFDCASGDASTNSLHVRDSFMNTPVFETGCTEADPDVNNADTTFGDDVPAQMKQIGTLSDVGINYLCNAHGTNNAAITWTYSTTNGYVGVFGFIANNAGFDYGSGATRQLDTSTVSPTISDFCSYHRRGTATSRAGDDNIGGVSATGNTGLFTIDDSISLGGALNGGSAETHHFTITQRYLNTGIYSHAIGLGCATGNATLVLPGSPGSITQLRNAFLDNAVVDWTTTVASPVTHGVADSGDGNFVAWIDSGNVVQAWASNGTVISSVALNLPGETLAGMEYDYDAEHLAVFTSGHARVYTTGFQTCVHLAGGCLGGVTANGPAPGTGCGTGGLHACISSSSSSGTSSSGADLLGLDLAPGAASLGVSVATYRAYLGLIYTVIIALVLAVGAGIAGVAIDKDSKVKSAVKFAGYGFLIGLPLGFGFTATMGFYPVGMILLVAFLAITILVLVLVFRRGR